MHNCPNNDFTALGTSEGRHKYADGIAQSFKCKLTGRPSCGEEDLKNMRVLNKIVRITGQGLRYEADPRHAELLAQYLDLENYNAVVTSGIKLPF